MARSKDNSPAWIQPQFFVSPSQSAALLDGRELLGGRKPKYKKRRKTKRTRFAAYIRISSEEQQGNFSMDAQLRAIQGWVTDKKGVLVKTYQDEAQSARTIDRPAFQQMRRDAKDGKFEALVVHKFDRFARNRTDALAVKSLLRNDYDIKVYSVSEPSEDSDGAIGALIEGIMESVADWYSKNLSAETAKGKKERTRQGLHNNLAPFGYRRDDNHILVADEHEAPGLKQAFELYAKGNSSDLDIARMLNRRKYLTRRGNQFSKDSIGNMLQNQTYLGKVCYQPYQRRSDGTRSREAPKEWLDGQHEALVESALFQKCQQVRAIRRSHRQPTEKYVPYLLRNLVYCHHCCTHRPAGEVVVSYGKMRVQTYAGKGKRYRCRARELGYKCQQTMVHADEIDVQVLDRLCNLDVPDDWRAGVTERLAQELGDDSLKSRLEKLQKRIRRVDVRWEHGFYANQQTYLEQQVALQHQMDSLIPVDNEELERTADLMRNFSDRLRDCDGDIEEQAELVKQILQRVYVQGKEVVGMTLKPTCHLLLSHKLGMLRVASGIK